MPASTVLVVEDAPTILQLLEVSFEIEGFAVLLAGDGAGDYVTKPFEPLDLVDRVNELLGR